MELLLAATTRNLVDRLKNAAAYPHDTDNIKVIETHISCVLLTGRLAYKIKKPVKLPFVDFSSLDRRHHFCQRELELNRRFAPELYLDVVPIGGTADKPVIGGEPPIEFAVRMKQFEPDRCANRMADRGELDQSLISSFASRIARFHASLKAASGSEPVQSTTRNLEELDRLIGESRVLRRLRDWIADSSVELETVFTERQEDGWVRDCHGDLHLGNVACVDGSLIPFDCLEFDDKLRTIDLIDEIAFFAMDLIAHERQDLAWSFVNTYLQRTGDYAGLRVWRYYCVHRALVRAKVRSLANDSPTGSTETEPIDPYLAVADQIAAAANPTLVITIGLSGSGKTTLTDELIGLLPAIRIRSDIERKRLSDLPALASSNSGVGRGLYDESTNDATYDRLCDAAQSALSGGVSVIVDASFLDRRRRKRFRDLAATLGVRFVMLNCVASRATLQERIEQRAASQADASEADVEVLRAQIAHFDPLDTSELQQTIEVDTTEAVDTRALVVDIETTANLPTDTSQDNHR